MKHDMVQFAATFISDVHPPRKELASHGFPPSPLFKVVCSGGDQHCKMGEGWGGHTSTRCSFDLRFRKLLIFDFGKAECMKKVFVISKILDFRFRKCWMCGKKVFTNFGIPIEATRSCEVKFFPGLTAFVRFSIFPPSDKCGGQVSI